ncbi:MAG: hypothetical protein SNG27_02705 [Rikenellaceae bacterium]
MVKRLFILICVVVAFTFSTYADEQGEKALVELTHRLREMGDYESDITLRMQSDVIEGHYRISGSDYHINMGSVELWGVGDKRYEVSHKIEEVVVERANKSENTLLGNPSQAFDLAEQGFNAELMQGSTGLILRLTPRSDDGAKIDVDQIVIHLDFKTLLPTKILYQADNESVEVEFGGIKKTKSSIEEFDISKYRKYDIVDLY